MTKIRTLDVMFRDSLIQDCIRLGVDQVDMYRLLGDPKTGRLQTVAIITKWVRHINKVYPGSMTVTVNHLKINPSFLIFMSTHNDLGTDEQDRRRAWASMRSIIDDAG